MTLDQEAVRTVNRVRLPREFQFSRQFNDPSNSKLPRSVTSFPEDYELNASNREQEETGTAPFDAAYK